MPLNLVLGGGGDPQDSPDVDACFVNLVRGRRILYIVDASVPEMWSAAEAADWIKSNNFYAKLDIVVAHNLSSMTVDNLLEYDGIYILGGNTFKLKHVLTLDSFDKKLAQYLLSSKPCFGMSAGAIVFGADIRTATIGAEKDENHLGICRFDGLDLLKGMAVHTHSIDKDLSDLHILSKQLQRDILCIPESGGIMVNGNVLRTLGCMVKIIRFADGAVETYDPGSELLCQ